MIGKLKIMKGTTFYMCSIAVASQMKRYRDHWTRIFFKSSSQVHPHHNFRQVTQFKRCPSQWGVKVKESMLQKRNPPMNALTPPLFCPASGIGWRGSITSVLQTQVSKSAPPTLARSPSLEEDLSILPSHLCCHIGRFRLVGHLMACHSQD